MADEKMKRSLTLFFVHGISNSDLVLMELLERCHVEWFRRPACSL